jgi:hypothetical protein
MNGMAITDVTEALKGLMEEALRELVEPEMSADKVYVGAPNRNDIGNHWASLFLFHIAPNAELRNADRFAAPPAIQPADRPAERLDALPLDLRYLITVFRWMGERGMGDFNELTTLGHIIRILHAQPTLAAPRVPNQVVRLMLEPYPMEELSRVWGLFPSDSYRTSVVYLASPVFVEVDALPAGRPVQTREQRTGLDSNPPDLLGRRRERLR